VRHYAQHRRISHVARASPPALQSTFSPSSMPTVSLDVTSLVASSCVCYGGHIEQRAAHEFAVHVAIQRRARETSTAPPSAARVARCARAGASLPTSTADPQVVALILVLQRGFIPVGSRVRCGACDVKDTPHGFSAVDRPGYQAPTAYRTRGGVRLSPRP
jgi:hypothetical protein